MTIAWCSLHWQYVEYATVLVERGVLRFTPSTDLVYILHRYRRPLSFSYRNVYQLDDISDKDAIHDLRVAN